jgi:hypothetical protein
MFQAEKTFTRFGASNHLGCGSQLRPTARLFSKLPVRFDSVNTVTKVHFPILRGAVAENFFVKFFSPRCKK